MTFSPATRTRSRGRVAIDGPAKSGKSMTALRLAFALGGKIAAIDTEFGSLSKYTFESPDDEGPFTFDVLELRQFKPENYISAIRDAERGGYDVLVIDSLSHAWCGEGGILDQKDKLGGGWSDWAKLTPQHRHLVDAILGSSIHVIATMRSKTEYMVEEYEEKGRKKSRPVKIGLAPVQREGMEYEFDLLCSIDQAHDLRVTGSRCAAMDGLTAHKPGAKFFAPYVAWLGIGNEPKARPIPEPSANGHATDAQIDTLHMHCKRLQITPEGISKRLKERFGISMFDELTMLQADELIAKLAAVGGAK